MDSKIRWSGLRRSASALVCLAAIAASPASAGSSPSGHAPIGVMGDHTHAKGEFMFSYRYMRMGMDGLRDEDERISGDKVLDDFMVTPTSMDMDMHMFGAMYAPVDRLTLMVMVPYIEMEMEHRTGTGVRFTTRTEGVGDVRAGGLIDLWSSGGAHANGGAHAAGHKLIANVMFSFPSGSITEEDRTPAMMGARVRLPFPMQIGSGTYDFLPGLTYTGRDGQIAWGAQGRGEIRLNENHGEYRQGNEYALTAWGAYDWNRWISTSLRAEWQHSLNFRGSAQAVGPMPTIPTKDPGRRAFQRLDFLAGVNLIVPEGPLSGLRFAVEAGVPAYQYLDGPGLETDFVATVGVQYAIH
ncbi:MAG: transporter [bacterium]|nr:transporter [bacterium]